jgi:predicted MFS family arabinose efflux permease
MASGQLWRERDFLKLWAGQAVSQMGSRISVQALPLAAVMALHASPFQMGLLNGAGSAAFLVFGLFAGAWADRVRRRPILIVADLGRAAILATIPLAAQMHALTMVHLYIAAAGTGLLTVFFDASYQAYVPSLVTREHILEANAKLALMESVADVGGPGLAGVLVQWISAPTAILFDAVSFLLSAISIWRIGKREEAPKVEAGGHIVSEIAEGLRTSRHIPILWALTKRTAMAGFFAGIIGGLYFVFAIRELGLSAALLGGIISLGGISNLFGALVSERLVKRFGIGTVIIGSALTCSGACLVPPLARGSVATCAAILAAGQAFDMAWPIYQINALSLRQAVTPDHLQGRVNASMHLLFYGLMSVGAAAGGAAAQVIGLRGAMLCGALGFLLSTVFLLASPIRGLRELPELKQAATL